MTASGSMIQPWLTVNDGFAAVEFYKEAFAAEETYHMEPGPGQLVARLTIGAASFWIAADSNATAVPEKTRFIVLVPDPETHVERAIAAGATEIFPVREEYGWKTGKVEDPFGYHWEFGYELSEE